MSASVPSVLALEDAENGRTPLVEAIARRELERAAQLLANGADASLATPDGWTALHLAAEIGDRVLVAELLARGAMATAVVASKGMTPLHLAAHGGHVDVVARLLAAGADVGARSVVRWTPLHNAAVEGRTDVIRMLLAHGADADATTEEGITALLRAANNGHESAALALVAHGADVTRANSFGLTPLHAAAGMGLVGLVLELLARGASVGAIAADGCTPLHIATREGRAGAVSVLLALSASVNTRDVNSITPLHYAARNGHHAVAIELIDHGADLDAANSDAWTPLHFSARHGHTAVVEVLLTYGASTDRQTSGGWTALHAAAENGDRATVAALLANGAPANATNAVGTTPLHSAAMNGQLAAAAELIAQGASVNASTTNGCTALHMAAEYDRVELAHLLLDSGASTEAKNVVGCTPLQIAVRMRRVAVTTALLGRGADADAADVNSVAPLHVAAENGDCDALAALLAHDAAVDTTTTGGLTPLHHAAIGGDCAVVTTLLAHGANRGARTTTGFVPLHIAAGAGRLSVVRLLLGVSSSSAEGAQHDARALEHLEALDVRGRTPVMVAGQSGHFAVVSELAKLGACLHRRAKDGETLLTSAAGWRHLEIVSELFDLGHLTSGAAAGGGGDDGKQGRLLLATLMTLNERALGTHEFFVLSMRVVERLMRVVERLGDPVGVSRESAFQFVLVVFRFARLQEACATDGVFERLVASQSIASRFRDLHTELTFLERDVGLEAAHDLQGGWKTQCAEDEETMLGLFKDEVESTSWSEFVARGGGDVVALSLQHKLSVQGGTCSQQLLELLEYSLRNVLAASKRAAPVVPSWFIPPLEIDMSEPWRSSGSAAETMRCTWSSSAVMLRVHRDDECEAFVAGVEACFPLTHPNVVKLFGASHLASPLVTVYESAASTHFRAFMRQDENKRAVWQKLLEVALGLAFLVERGMAVDALRCDDVWVGTDGAAKLCAYSCTTVPRDAGARRQRARWQAPEVVLGGAATAASAVFSFAMCILEALTGEVPLPASEDGVAQEQVMRGFQPALPPGLSHAQGLLLRRMWHFDPSKRPSLPSVVLQMKHFAHAEKDEAMYHAAAAATAEDIVVRSRVPRACSDLRTFRFPELGSTMDAFVDKLARKAERCQQTEHAALTHIVKRLRGVSQLIQKRQQHPREVGVVSFCEVLMDFDALLGTASGDRSMLQRSKSQKVSLRGNVFHRRLDELLQLLAPSVAGSIHEWKRALPSADLVSDDANRVESRTAPQAPTGGPVEIVRFEAERLNERFAALGFEPSSSRGAAPVSGSSARPAWLIDLHDVKYSASTTIGRGAFGEVYKATWRNTPVVVKFMGFEADADAYSNEMFFHELRVWFPLNHPHVIKLFGAGHVGKRFFACEFAEHGTLDEYLRRGEENARRVWLLLHQVGLGLQYLHEQTVMHNDLKCDNVLIGGDGNAKITDFGLSCILNSAEIRVDPKRQGAVHWRSPEYIRGDRKTLASDVYSFGMCIVEALTGESPWGRSTLDVMVRYRVKKGLLPPQPASMSTSQWTLIRMMCASDPAQRVAVAFVVDKLFDFAQQQ